MIFSRSINKHSVNAVLAASSHVFRPLYVVRNCRICRGYSVMEGCNMHPKSRRTYQVVVAATRAMGIGKDGKLPWKLPSDIKFFKEVTTYTSDETKKNAIIMGRKTWDSIPIRYRPLFGRLNVVLTRSTTCNVANSENVVTCGSFPSALELLASSPYSLEIDNVFVIGGGQILREAMNGPGCEAIHLTEIDSNIECDTFIPHVDVSVFRPWSESVAITENDISFRFVSYVRACNSSDPDKVKLEVNAFFPNIIYDKHDEFKHHHHLE